jgi:hypothetical protein
MGKNHDREWTHHGILAEIKKRHATPGMLHPKNFASDALVLSDVLPCLSNGNAICPSEGCTQKQSD